MNNPNSWIRGEGSESEEEYEDDTLGPCGCTDYHMADCAVISSDPDVHDTGMTKEDWLSIEGDWWDD